MPIELSPLVRDAIELFAPIAVGLLLALFLSRFLRKKKTAQELERERLRRQESEEQFRAQMRADQLAGENARRERQRRDAQLATEKAAAQKRAFELKMGQVSSIMHADPLFARQLERLAGIPPQSGGSSSVSQATIETITSRLPNDKLAMFTLAASQTQIDFKVERKHSREPVAYPTNDVEPTPMTDFSQMASLLPEQLLQEDDIFFTQLVTNQLLVMQSFETQDDRKIMYVLVDVSDSMKSVMSPTMTRHAWSQAVTMSLLLKAVRGEATYFLRFFDGRPHSLHEVLSPDQASQLINGVLDQGLTDGGTNIFNAFSQAISDIRTKGGLFSQAEVLIISDGEDNSMSDKNQIKQMLGDDIKLHVAMVGNDSTVIKEVATTYQRFN